MVRNLNIWGNEPDSIFRFDFDSSTDLSSPSTSTTQGSDASEPLSSPRFPSGNDDVFGIGIPPTPQFDQGPGISWSRTPGSSESNTDGAPVIHTPEIEAPMWWGHAVTAPPMVQPPPTAMQISRQRSLPPKSSSSSAVRGRKRKSTKLSKKGPSTRVIKFINFTPNDSREILAGVAPSGSSKTKAKRKKEVLEMARQLRAAALNAVRAAGGDVESLVEKGLFVGSGDESCGNGW